MKSSSGVGRKIYKANASRNVDKATFLSIYNIIYAVMFNKNFSNP